jgi:hypothetical protein
MTLVVEDGTGLANADAYVSLDDCEAYAAARGLTFATSPSAAGEAAIRVATAFIDNTYRSRFTGQRLNGRSQALEWPRIYATDAAGNDIASDEIPVEIVNATCEAAIREFAAPGTLTPDLERGGGVKRLKAGSVEIEYMAGALAQTLFTAVDAALSGLIQPRSMFSGRAVRA